MSDAQIVTVDVRKLGMGMSHAFQGMAEVCASLGVPKENLLGAVDDAEKVEAQPSPSALKRKLDEQAARSRGRTSVTHSQEVKEDADQAKRSDMDVAGDADSGDDAGGNSADAAASMSEGQDKDSRDDVIAGKTNTTPAATADDITRILSAKVQQKKIKAADAKALLEKYGAKSVSTLSPQYYDAVLEEASSM